MKQKSFVINLLLIGVLALSACSKADSPKGNYSGNNGGDGDGGGSNTPSLGDIVKGICNKNASAQICQDINGNEEASLEEAKPILDLGEGNVYGAKNPATWTAGITTDLQHGVYNSIAVDDGSIFTANEPTITKYYNQADGSKAARPDISGAISPGNNGGLVSVNMNAGDAGKTLMRLTFVTDVHKYVILPPIKITAN